MKTLYPFLLVFLGGGIGAALRYSVNLLLIDSSLPLSTLSVNVVGSFLLGVVLVLAKVETLGPLAVLFLGVGIMGGLTTFSGFSAQTIKLVEQAGVSAALSNVLLNNVLCLGMCWLGFQLGRFLS